MAALEESASDNLKGITRDVILGALREGGEGSRDGWMVRRFVRSHETKCSAQRFPLLAGGCFRQRCYACDIKCGNHVRYHGGEGYPGELSRVFFLREKKFNV